MEKLKMPNEQPLKIQDLLNLKEENEKLRNQLAIKKKKAEPIELDSIRRFLVDAVKDQNVVDGFKLKLLFGVAFGIPQDSLEMQQLHELQIKYENKFLQEEVKCKERLQDEKEKTAEKLQSLDQMVKILKYGLIALAVGVGLPVGAGELLRLFGLG